jgi:hypothetical protein
MPADAYTRGVAVSGSQFPAFGGGAGISGPYSDCWRFQVRGGICFPIIRFARNSADIPAGCIAGAVVVVLLRP